MRKKINIKLKSVKESHACFVIARKSIKFYLVKLLSSCLYMVLIHCFTDHFNKFIHFPPCLPLSYLFLASRTGITDRHDGIVLLYLSLFSTTPISFILSIFHKLVSAHRYATASPYPYHRYLG